MTSEWLAMRRRMVVAAWAGMLVVGRESRGTGGCGERPEKAAQNGRQDSLEGGAEGCF
jgi:hypothetical protein